MPYANNKGADQPAHPRSLISTFIAHYLDSIMPILAKAKFPRAMFLWQSWFVIEKICRCELNYMVKFHCQINRAMLSELSKMCSCKWRTLTK